MIGERQIAAERGGHLSGSNGFVSQRHDPCDPRARHGREREHVPRDGLALALGQAERLLRTAGRDVAVYESVHPHHALDAGIPAQIAPKTIVAPIVAKEIVQQCCAYDRSGLVPRQTHPAGDGIGRLRHGNRLVIDRISLAMVLKAAQLLKAGMLQNIPGKLLDLAVQWTHPFLCFCL